MKKGEDMKIFEGKTAIFLGDSITEGACASTVENSFVHIFGERTGAKVYNFGLGGTRIAYQRKPSLDEPQYDVYFASRIFKMPEHADMVFVFGGTNDYGHGDAPLGALGDKTPCTFYGALHDLYTRLQTKYPNAQIFAITPLHCDNDEQEVNGRGVDRKGGLLAYVNAVKAVAKAFCIPVLDAFHDWGMKPIADKDNDPYFWVDGLHPNDNGHKRIAEQIVKFFEDKK